MLSPTENLFRVITSQDINPADVLRLVKTYIDQGANLATLDEKHLTPIQVARESGKWDIVLCIAQNYKTNLHDNFKYGSALLEAIKRKNPDCDPLLAAILQDCIDALIAAGASLTWRYHTFTGYTSLHLAIVNNLRKIIPHLTINLCTKDNQARTPLLLAAELERWDFIELMIVGRQHEVGDFSGYGKALKLAVINNQNKLVSSLLIWGSNIESEDKDESLLLAIDSQNKEVISLLIQHDCSLSQLNKEKTPIEEAALSNKWSAVYAIAINKKTDNADTFRYKVALIEAIAQRKSNSSPELLNCIHALLQAGAALTQKKGDDDDGVLHYAVKNNDIEVVALLLHFNCPYNLQNKLLQKPEMINKKCFGKGWAIHEMNKYLFKITMIPKLILLGAFDRNSVFSTLTLKILENILRIAAGGLILNRKNTMIGADFKYKKILDSELDEELERNKSIFYTSLTDNGKILVKNLHDANNLQNVFNQTNAFLLTQFASGGIQKESLTINFLRKYSLFNEQHYDFLKQMHTASCTHKEEEHEGMDFVVLEK